MQQRLQYRHFVDHAGPGEVEHHRAGFIWASPPASIIPRVASISGTWTVRKLLCLSTSPRLCAFFTVAGRLHAASTVISGS